MTTHKHTVQLSKSELTELQDITRRGTYNTRTVTRARILLLSHAGNGKDAIAESLGINRSTVRDVRNRYHAGGLEGALHDAPRSGKPGKIDATLEAHIVAIACSDPPEGRERWTLTLITERIKREKRVTLSSVSVWRHLNNRDIKPWREKNVVHTEGDA